jgi:signal transduction protein with GAF and PtsI domain
MRRNSMTAQNKIDLDLFKLVFEAITKSDNIDIMANQITQYFVGALGIKGATIFIVNTELEELEILASSGLSMNYINKGPVLVDKSIKLAANREPVIISDVAKSDRLQYPENAREEGIKAIVSFPINLRGKIIGALRLYHSEIWEISPKEAALVQVLSGNIGIALMYFRLANAILCVKETVDDIHSVWL